VRAVDGEVIGMVIYYYLIIVPVIYYYLIIEAQSKRNGLTLITSLLVCVYIYIYIYEYFNKNPIHTKMS
jgi:tryptophan-rich sensory protein